MSLRGRTGTVFRAVKRNEDGDPVDDDGNVIRIGPNGLGEMGVIKGVVMGGLSASPTLSREESSDTSGQIGIPVKNTVKVQFGDQIAIDNVVYRVISRDLWNYENSLSTTKPKHYWVKVVARVD
ncbi:hypothetical protein R2325_16400 [Mycobacteroides chelonae]|jgi:hypothetical protein|uniref:hypothetical protein n=1 Tax=Mycobacteroides TaxID=670516 RepID=UPI00092AD328|nr:MULTISPECIES: hypothetical protein [Mycobacteroides]MBV6360435.1 hypothetical protein [Mycobacteroides chelonae]MEC4857156.1 hypothetical protein [Mycobacteroides chelonae]MEC4873566.1 hypothetical protein [Mycobacteroides chelonae]SHW93637.1 Uncharacterised protein [Mycobacteroides abscessus subsp. abscessus]SKL80963.1 Uncharacterised protein [Mycobacteroides abscessus subsp. abscessus]